MGKISRQQKVLHMCGCVLILTPGCLFSVFSNINGDHESTLTTSKKYSWCILVQKEIKPVIWGAAITPEPYRNKLVKKPSSMHQADSFWCLRFRQKCFHLTSSSSLQNYSVNFRAKILPHRSWQNFGAVFFSMTENTGRDKKHLVCPATKQGQSLWRSGLSIQLPVCLISPASPATEIKARFGVVWAASDEDVSSNRWLPASQVVGRKWASTGPRDRC